MRTSKTVLPILLLLTLFFVACEEDNETNFTAPLAGASEVPPVTTSASGRADFTHNEDTDTIDFALNVTNISNGFAAHIHSGTAGVNGPILVTLFMGPNTGPNFTGQLASGTIDAGDITGMTVAQLVAAMRGGQTYVNVHTDQNPNGEIRGQIVNLD
jgi:hypothetical protein